MMNSPKICISGEHCEPAGLKEAMSCALQHDPERGSRVEAVAAILDIKPGTLRDGINPNEPDWVAPKHFDTIVICTASHPAIAQHVARLSGGVFIKVDGRQFDRSVANCVVEFGQFLQSVPSGPLTGDTVARIDKEGDEAIAAILKVIADAKARALNGGLR